MLGGGRLQLLRGGPSADGIRVGSASDVLRSRRRRRRHIMALVRPTHGDVAPAGEPPNRHHVATTPPLIFSDARPLPGALVSRAGSGRVAPRSWRRHASARVRGAKEGSEGAVTPTFRKIENSADQNTRSAIGRGPAVNPRPATSTPPGPPIKRNRRAWAGTAQGRLHKPRQTDGRGPEVPGRRPSAPPARCCIAPCPEGGPRPRAPTLGLGHPGSPAGSGRGSGPDGCMGQRT